MKSADFASVSLTHVRREQNKRADELCNIALDAARPRKPAQPAAGPKAAKKPAATVTDGRVREDALECLRSARAVWSRGESVPSPELVWDQLWSILEEGGVLKKK